MYKRQLQGLLPQQFRIGEHRGQGRFQVVGHVGDQLYLHPFAAGLLCQGPVQARLDVVQLLRGLMQVCVCLLYTSYGEFYEQRWFASGSGVEHGIELCGQHVSLCTNQTFACDTMPNLVIGVEICEDLWAPAPPSVELARKGATVILNLSASNELVGKADYRRSLVTGQSARLMRCV